MNERRPDLDPLPPAGEAEPAAASPAPRPPSWRGYAGALLVVAACTAIAAPMHAAFELSNLAMIYLVGVVAAAVAFGRGPAVAASILGVAVFDFGFVPPRFTFRVSDTQYLVTLAVMLGVGTLIATLTARLREQLAGARQRERRTAALFRLSHELASHGGTGDLLGAAIPPIAAVFGGRVAMLLPDGNGGMRVAAGDAGLAGAADHELIVGEWAFAHRQPAGLGTPNLSGARGTFVPLVASERALGVIAVRPAALSESPDPERLRLLQTFANQIALALERTQLAEAAARARTLAETERTRSALLSSVSHDLRTPLAVITGAATSLRDDPGTLSAAQRRDLADTAAEEALRLNRLIGQLLDMTRLESGALAVRKDWHPIEEVVGAALARLEPRLGARVVRLAIPADLPLVPLDDVLFEQVVENLVENAIKYSPAERPIEIGAAVEGDRLRFEVGDHGPGFVPGEEERVFEKFHRGGGTSGRPGVGLGLAITRGIVAAHGGAIVAANRPGGGAIVTLWLPLEGGPPGDAPPDAL